MLRIYTVDDIVHIYVCIHVYSYNSASSTTPIWLDELRCSGQESQLFDCPASPIGDNDCTHLNDIGLVCREGTYENVYIYEPKKYYEFIAAIE